MLGGAVVLAVLVTFIVFGINLLTATVEKNVREAALRIAEYERQLEQVSGIIQYSSNSITLVVSNGGPTAVLLTSLFLEVETPSENVSLVIDLASQEASGGIVTGIEVEPSTAKTSSGVVIEPGRSVAIVVSTSATVEDARAVGFTARGKEIIFRQPTGGGEGAATAIAATMMFFTVPTLTDLLGRNDVYVDPELLAPASPSDPGVGIAGGTVWSGVYCLYREYEDVDVSGYVYYTALYLGFDASWTMTRSGTARYSMMIVATSRWGGDLGIGRDKYGFGNYPAYRIVIYGFSGSITVRYTYYDLARGRWITIHRSNAAEPSDVVGIYLYGQYYGYYTGAATSRIYLDGHAEKVLVYVRTTLCGFSTEVSYTPFTIIADFDNNGYPEILFTTEDALFDAEDEWYGNDHDTTRFSWTDIDLNDVSDKPFRIVFRGYPIDSTKYAAVQIAIRYYFHDNAARDEEEIQTNDWIVRVGLIDAQTGDEASYYELRFQTLTRYEDTYPPDWDYRIDVVLLLVPNTGHTYYLFVEFRDPYTSYSYIDDADVMIAIEYLSMTYISR